MNNWPSHLVSGVLIVGTAALGLVSVHLVGRRVLAWMHALKRIREARRQQLVTLVHTTQWILNVLLMVSALLMLLSEFGVDITPLLASVSVAGLAMSLGAESLTKDLIGGLLILIENQYAVGDSKGSTQLLYALADELVADYMRVVEGFDEAIDRIEDLVFSAPTPSLPGQIFALKRALLHLWRIITPQREALNKLARGDYAVIDAKDRVFFQDEYDHLVRLYDISECLRDLVGGALDTYLSAVNSRMNDVMKTLTVITTLFMPVSFLAGFFGMNFFHTTVPLEAWTGRVAFRPMVTAMILLPLGMFLWIRRRAWM